ncbi:MAG: hypothetical protein SOY02_00095 [Candidatus Onthovivens sp.]|nr:hypothetical protein [Candidatus Onthovivens sp.]
MFKMKKILLVGGALLLLAGCSEPEFEQNEDPIVEGFSMYIVGSHWNNWEPSTIKEANPSCAFTYDEATKLYVYDATVTADMLKGWVGFKFISGNSWDSQYGMEDIDYSICNDTFTTMVGVKAQYKEGAKNRSNIVAKVAGTYHITYNPADFRSDTIKDGVTHTYKFGISIQ